MIRNKTLAVMVGALILSVATASVTAQTSSTSAAPDQNSANKHSSGTTTDTTTISNAANNAANGAINGTTSGTTNSASDTADTTSMTASTTTGSSTAGKYVGISTRDRNFMRELAYQNMAEIELAKLAQSKSKNDEVLSFANRMLTDHSKALEDLQQLALKKGVALPTAGDIASRTQLVMFKAMPVATFDKNYISKGGISDHQKTHRLLSNINNRAQDPDLKALSTAMMQVVEQHQQLAQQMAQHPPVVR